MNSGQSEVPDPPALASRSHRRILLISRAMCDGPLVGVSLENLRWFGLCYFTLRYFLADLGRTGKLGIGHLRDVP